MGVWRNGIAFPSHGKDFGFDSQLIQTFFLLENIEGDSHYFHKLINEKGLFIDKLNSKNFLNICIQIKTFMFLLGN